MAGPLLKPSSEGQAVLSHQAPHCTGWGQRAETCPRSCWEWVEAGSQLVSDALQCELKGRTAPLKGGGGILGGEGTRWSSRGSEARSSLLSSGPAFSLQDLPGLTTAHIRVLGLRARPSLLVSPPRSTHPQRCTCSPCSQHSSSGKPSLTAEAQESHPSYLLLEGRSGKPSL